MNADQLADRLSHPLAPRRLLGHPFYRRWEAGALRPGERHSRSRDMDRSPQETHHGPDRCPRLSAHRP